MAVQLKCCAGAPHVSSMGDSSGQAVGMHRNMEAWRQLGRRQQGAPALESGPEPTLDGVRRGHEPSPVKGKA